MAKKKGTCPATQHGEARAKKARHQDKLTALRRIEGQVRGVQKMIDEERYCVDILNATSAVIGALKRVESKILKDHLESCAKSAFEGKNRKEKDEKLGEIYGLLEKMRK